MNEKDKSPGKPHWPGSFLFVLLAFLGIAAFFLWSEHRAHLLGALPFILLLLCPLLHLFMHRGHHHGRHPGESGDGASDSEKGGET